MKNFLKNIFTILIFAGAYYVLERYAMIPTAFKYIRFSYAQPVVNFASVVFGHLIGAVSSGLGEFFTLFADESRDWPAVFCALLNCGSIGYAMRNNKISEGLFSRKEHLHLDLVQFCSNFICWVLLYPLLGKLLMHKEFQPALNYGFGRAIGMTVSNGIAGSLIISLYARTRISAANFYRS